MGHINKNGVSVLISVYEKEKPEYLERALESLQDQEYIPDEIVLVKDGALPEQLEEVIKEFKKKYSGLKTVELKKNRKLGRALAAGLKHCSFNLVARMDSDDIALSSRFQIQKTFMEAHSGVSAVGGDIAEFLKESEILRIKHMPSSYQELLRYAKLRNPLNHMTVMFRKEDIEAVGGYVHFPDFEDYHLWSRLLAGGYKIANIPKVLVKARTGSGFAGRRGGIDYFRRFYKLRCFQRQIGLIGYAGWVKAVCISALICLPPPKMRDFIYHILRRRNKCKNIEK